MSNDQNQTAEAVLSNDLLGLLYRLRFALGDGEGKLTHSQLTRRAHELRQKAAKWDEWYEAQNQIEQDMPEGWAFVIQCSPGDWDLYLLNADGERVQFDRDCDSTAQVMQSAIECARELALKPNVGIEPHLPAQGER